MQLAISRCLIIKLLETACKTANLLHLMSYEPRHEETGFLHTQIKLHSNCAADQRLCFCHMDSTIPLLPKSEISSLLKFYDCTSLFVSDLVRNPEDLLSHNQAHIIVGRHNETFESLAYRKTVLGNTQKSL